jgi:hypothetical protein
MKQMTSSSSVYHHRLSLSYSLLTCYEWNEDKLMPFDELILSWNAYRPPSGYYTFSISLKMNETWSPWILYAQWGGQEQKSFATQTNSSISLFQDTVNCLNGELATGFKVLLASHEGTFLANIFALHVCTTHLEKFNFCEANSAPLSIQLPVPGLSQLALPHPRKQSFCSPTSTTAAVRYLSHPSLLPIYFAKNVHDAGFDIYGNWVFNIAQAFIELGEKWECWVMHCTNWKTITHQLSLGIPVVVSVKGSLPGSLFPYENGHLIVIKGYDSNTQHVLCMDPAFPSDEQTDKLYRRDDFIQAWKRRLCIAYFFQRQP